MNRHFTTIDIEIIEVLIKYYYLSCAYEYQMLLWFSYMTLVSISTLKAAAPSLRLRAPIKLVVLEALVGESRRQ